MWGGRLPWVPCPSIKGDLVNTEDDARLPVWCRRWWCVPCARRWARNLHRVLVITQPSKMDLFTGLSPDWPVNQRRMQRLKLTLRRGGYGYRSAWAIEPNPSGLGYHAHGWSYGDPIPEPEFQAAAHQAGFGYSRQLPVTHAANFGYIVKLAAWNEASSAAFRQLNGVQAIHASKGFWRDARTGEMFTLDEAVVRANAVFRSPSDQQWYFEARRRSRLLPRGLSPAAAARIRARRAELPGLCLIEPLTGEVLASFGRPAVSPIGTGIIGPVVVTNRTPGHPPRMLRNGQMVPVQEVRDAA